jgi:hypothetical protein
MGADLAKQQDYTSVRVFRTNVEGKLGREVAFWRGNQLSWRIQKDTIANLSRRFNNAAVVVDATGLGDPVCDDLEAAGLPLERFKFTASSKQALIDNFIAKGQTHQIELLAKDADPVAYQEGCDFEYEIVIPKGRMVVDKVTMRYGHPQGKHDDTVIARALAVHGMSNVITHCPVW